MLDDLHNVHPVVAAFARAVFGPEACLHAPPSGDSNVTNLWGEVWMSVDGKPKWMVVEGFDETPPRVMLAALGPAETWTFWNPKPAATSFIVDDPASIDAACRIVRRHS